jgi:hypothetical protein
MVMKFRGMKQKQSFYGRNIKKILGISEYSHMYFDLQTLLSPSENIEGLEEPFKKDEIDQIVQQLPSDKSPGPDGFNGYFLKK